MNNIVYSNISMSEQIENILSNERGTENDPVVITLIFNGINGLPEKSIGSLFSHDSSPTYIKLVIESDELSIEEWETIQSKFPIAGKDIVNVTVRSFYGTSMSGMFSNGASLKTVLITTSPNVTSIDYLCSNCSVLERCSIDGLESLQSSVQAFEFCRSLIYFQENISSNFYIDTSMMFLFCSALTEIDLYFLSPRIRKASNMFANCTSLSKLGFANFSSVSEAHGMFVNCVNITTLPWDSFGRITAANSMFAGCRKLESIDASYMENCTSWSNAFQGCSALKNLYAPQYLSRIFRGDFSSSNNFNSLFGPTNSESGYLNIFLNSIRNSDDEKKTIELFYKMYNTTIQSNYKTISFILPTLEIGKYRDYSNSFNSETKIYEISYQDTVSFIIWSFLNQPKLSFSEGIKINQTYISSSWDFRVNIKTSFALPQLSINYSNSQFDYCRYTPLYANNKNYKYISFISKLPSSVKVFGIVGEGVVNAPDLSETSFSNIDNFFRGCKDLLSIPQLPPSVTSAKGTFKGCTSLVEADLSAYKNLKDTTEMFKDCSSLRSCSVEDLFIETADYMFSGCTSFVSGVKYSLPYLTSAVGMFENCTNMIGITVNFPRVIKASQMFYNDSFLHAVNGATFPNSTDISEMFYGCEQLGVVRDFLINANTDCTNAFSLCKEDIEVKYVEEKPSTNDIVKQNLILIEPTGDSSLPLKICIYDSLLDGDTPKIKKTYFTESSNIIAYGYSQELLVDNAISTETIVNVLKKKYRFGDFDGEPKDSLIIQAKDVSKVRSNIVNISDEELQSIFEEE